MKNGSLGLRRSYAAPHSDSCLSPSSVEMLMIRENSCDTLRTRIRETFDEATDLEDPPSLSNN